MMEGLHGPWRPALNQDLFKPVQVVHTGPTRRASESPCWGVYLHSNQTGQQTTSACDKLILVDICRYLGLMLPGP
jgi:hypothetical protein